MGSKSFSILSRRLSFLLLGVSLVGLSFTIWLFLYLVMFPLPPYSLQSPPPAPSSFDTYLAVSGYYEIAAPIFLPMSVFSLALSLRARGRLNMQSGIGLVSILVLMFFFMIPVIPVEKTWPGSCLGSYTDMQSLSYFLSGLGLHTPNSICVSYP